MGLSGRGGAWLAGLLAVVSVFLTGSSNATSFVQASPYQSAGAGFGLCAPDSDQYVLQLYRQVKANSTPFAGVVEHYAVSKYVFTDFDGQCVLEGYDIHPASDASVWELPIDGTRGRLVGPSKYGMVDLVVSRASDEPHPVLDWDLTPNVFAPPGRQRVIAGAGYFGEATGSLGDLFTAAADDGALIVLFAFDLQARGSI